MRRHFLSVIIIVKESKFIDIIKKKVGESLLNELNIK